MHLSNKSNFDGGTDLSSLNSSTYTNSGTYEIIWDRDTDGGETHDFKPIAPDGVVKFFGRINPGGGGADNYGPFEDLGSNITLDEDVISGEPDSPPVMTLNISVPDAQDAAVQIQVIYYETSGIEFILGGEPCVDRSAPRNGSSLIRDSGLHERTKLRLKITMLSFSTPSPMKTRPTTRSTSHCRRPADLQVCFQGSLRLTDADGNGGPIDPITRVQDASLDQENWGRAKTQGLYDETEALLGDRLTTAVLGVGNGPVEITYKDTDGQNRSYQIEIDILPPTITVDSPEHKGRSDDEKPAFIGTFNDSDSGLAANSFQLDVDNDGTDPGDDRPVNKVLADVTSETHDRRR